LLQPFATSATLVATVVHGRPCVGPT